MNGNRIHVIDGSDSSETWSVMTRPTVCVLHFMKVSMYLFCYMNWGHWCCGSRQKSGRNQYLAHSNISHLFLYGSTLDKFIIWSENPFATTVFVASLIFTHCTPSSVFRPLFHRYYCSRPNFFILSSGPKPNLWPNSLPPLLRSSDAISLGYDRNCF